MQHGRSAIMAVSVMGVVISSQRHGMSASSFVMLYSHMEALPRAFLKK